MLCMTEFNKYKYTRCPKNFLTECCWSDCAPGLENHFLRFLNSLCLCLLFSHVQCCNHSDKLWERLKVPWTKLLCSEDFEMEKLVTDSSATSTLSSNTPLPTSSYALVNPLSLPLRVTLCLQTAAEQLAWLNDQRQSIEVSHHIPPPTASSFEEVVGETKDPQTLPDIGMIALEWMDMTLISLIWGGGVQVGWVGKGWWLVVVGRGYLLLYFRAVLDTRPQPSFLQNHWEDCG